MRSKRDLLAQALHGQLKSHHRFLISEQLTDIDELDEAIGRMSMEIAERLHPYEHQIQRLSTIPGIKRRLAEVILAEIGPDMSRFPSARHLASWAGMCAFQQREWGQTTLGQNAQRKSLVAFCLSGGGPCRYPL